MPKIDPATLTTSSYQYSIWKVYRFRLLRELIHPFRSTQNICFWQKLSANSWYGAQQTLAIGKITWPQIQVRKGGENIYGNISATNNIKHQSHSIKMNKTSVFFCFSSFLIKVNSTFVYFALLLRMIPSYFCWNHFMASSFVSRCGNPTWPTLRRRWATLNPEKNSKKKIWNKMSKFMEMVVWLECLSFFNREFRRKINGFHWAKNLILYSHLDWEVN